jgi:hypothetical protein
LLEVFKQCSHNVDFALIKVGIADFVLILITVDENQRDVFQEDTARIWLV